MASLKAAAQESAHGWFCRWDRRLSQLCSTHITSAAVPSPAPTAMGPLGLCKARSTEQTRGPCRTRPPIADAKAEKQVFKQITTKYARGMTFLHLFNGFSLTIRSFPL